MEAQLVTAREASRYLCIHAAEQVLLENGMRVSDAAQTEGIHIQRIVTDALPHASIGMFVSGTAYHIGTRSVPRKLTIVDSASTG